MNASKKILPKLLLSCAVFTLAACASTTESPQVEQSDKIHAAIEKATAAATGKNVGGQSLGAVEQTYKQNSSDPEAALDYAAKLRETGQLDQAELVLAPFANDPKSQVGAKTEYAAIQLALGNNIAAEEYGKKSVLQDPENGQAYHYLGIALDAQGKHPEAERAFRKALEHWEGDPTPIMNNLALNLATQNYTEEALEILEKAKAISPNRKEVERNLRIVMALKQSNGVEAPKPASKPEKTAAKEKDSEESSD